MVEAFLFLDIIVTSKMLINEDQSNMIIINNATHNTTKLHYLYNNVGCYIHIPKQLVQIYWILNYFFLLVLTTVQPGSISSSIGSGSVLWFDDDGPMLLIGSLHGSSSLPLLVVSSSGLPWL